MNNDHYGRVAILYPGDYEARRNATPENNRLAQVFQAMADLKLYAEPAVYHNDFCEEVQQQLMRFDAVLVWMNPIQDGCDRSILDSMLSKVAAAGVYVTAHPDIILKMGTKEVLYRTRDVGWGCNTHLYLTMEQMRREFSEQLASGKARVLKQYRGNGGNGVWKVELEEKTHVPKSESIVRVRHARRGSIEEKISLNKFFSECEKYFLGNGKIIDQEYQERLPEGMTRCYLVHDKVAGFGHQEINALYPARPGESPDKAPLPGPRLYYPPTLSRFQTLKCKLEQVWLPELQRILDIKTEELPVLWDCDFLLGPKTQINEDSYVLCEINVSSVAPFPESAPPYIAKAVFERIKAMNTKKCS